MTREWVYQNYLDYLSEYHPKYHQVLDGNESLKNMFFLINDVFIVSEICRKDFFESKNYFNLVNEFKIYASRLMILLPLNDKYMLDAILRLLVEKLYRIIYSLYCPDKLERNIRRQSRNTMSEKMSGNVLRKNDLDDLYAKYSTFIHHTDSLHTDSFNFRELANYDETLILEIKPDLSSIVEIFIEEFLLKVWQPDQVDLATKLSLNDNLTQYTLRKLGPLL